MPRAAGARKTLTCRAHWAPSHHVWKTVHPTVMITQPAGAGKTPARSPQDQGRLPRLTPCPTVCFLQYSTTAPRDSGENDDFHDPLLMYIVTPCDYKRRRRAPLKGDVGRDHPDTSTTLSTRYWHSPLSSSPLAETWELPSLSRLACTPYYRHLRCKIIQCPRTPPCWTYGPMAGTRINPCVTVLPLASTSGTRKHAAFTSWNPDPRVRAPTLCVENSSTPL